MAVTPEHWKRVAELFEAAIEHEPEARADFVARATAGDAPLAEEVLRLIASDENAGTFLNNPAGLNSDESSSKTAPDPFIGRILSHYRLEARLGSGGMGVVYRATDMTLGRAVAVKLLSRQLCSSEGAKARFLREARAASALDHPNIAAVYDAGEHEGELFIVMALVEGETLKQCLEKGRLPAQEVIDILGQMAEGLQAAHAAGIIHRDIKPANVLLTQSGTVKLLDFGLAKQLLDEASSAVTQAGEVLGTPLYMSPEQLRGGVVDERSDLWALGVVAYELLAGAPPFSAESTAAIAARILHEEPPPLNFLPDGPTALAEVVRQLLQKNAAARIQTAAELCQRLDTAKSSPAPPTPAGVQPKSAGLNGFAEPKRRRVVRTLALVLVAIGVLAVAPGLFYYFFFRGHARGPNASGPGGNTATIAVLPFASLGSSEENAYFAEGFHDELLRQLGGIRDLRVISRTSVMQYKDGARNLREIAEALGVSSVVEGSVQRAGDRVRVEARLIDARNDLQIWSDRYDRDVSDIFGIQTAVAEQIASALHAQLSPAQRAQIEQKPTRSEEAYDLYLRAKEYGNRPGAQPGNLEIAERFYRQAIQMDPSFALARAQLARASIARYYQLAGTSDTVVEDARAEAQEALRLQPDLAEAHLALGSYYSWRGDHERALQEYELARSGARAAAVAAISGLLKKQGRFDDAIRAQSEVVRLDPRAAQALWSLGLSLLWTRRYEEADRVLDGALKIAPDFASASMIKALVHEAWQGDTHLAKAVLREARGRLDPQGRVGLQDWVLHLLLHNPGEALPVLDSLDSEWIVSFAFYPKVYLYAIAHEALGDVARARKEYEMARLAVEATMAKHTGHTNPAGIGSYRAMLAHSYAGLALKEDALREAARAVEIVPYSKDSHWGCYFEVDRAMVEGRVGETYAAIEHIRHLLSIPCLLSPGLLRVDPRWAPLRNDPRFRKLAELE